ncbi:MAG TPA: lipid II flippase MurJ [Thermoanaerobaculia bacterium]
MRLSIWLALISSASMAAAFAIQWLIVVIVGPGRSTDVFFASSAVPQLILSVVTGSLVHVLVPLLAGEDSSSARRNAWTVLIGVTSLFSAAALLLGLTVGWWMPPLFPGFAGGWISLLLELSRIQFLGMVFAAALGVLVAFCYSRNRFILAESTQLCATAIGAAALYWLLPQFGIRAAAWVSVGRSAAAALVMIPLLGTFGLAGSAGAVLRKTWERIRPLLLGAVYYKTDPLVDRILASMAPAGALSLYYLGSQIYGAGAQVLNTAVAAPLIPRLATSAKSSDWRGFRAAYRRRLIVLLLLTVPPYVVLLFFGERLLLLLIGHGGVTAENVSFLWKVMVGLGGVLIAGSLGFVTSGIFYARGDTRTPTKVGIVTYTMYVPLKVLIFWRFGLVGVAVSTSAFVTLNVLVQLFLAEREGLGSST